MTSYPSTAKEWKRRKDSVMGVSTWVFAALCVTTVIAVAWLVAGLVP